MIISQLIKELKEMKKEHGDIQVTCTHSLFPESNDIFETTIKNLKISKLLRTGKCVKVCF